MLTNKQKDLLLYIHEQIKETGVSPSFDEMKTALNLASKSGIHRLITALEERGFIRRLPNRARALEVLKLPNSATTSAPPRGRQTFKPAVVTTVASNENHMIPIVGRIAAGVPIEAIQQNHGSVIAPEGLAQDAEHFALEVKGDSMIDAGILEKDIVILKKTEDCRTGDIVVALIEDEEATLKRLRLKGNSIALEAANPAYETRIFGPDKVKVQGKLVALVRRYD